MKPRRFALCLLAMCCNAPTARAEPSAYDIARPSVVTIAVRTDDGGASQGSGVIVGLEQVVTNCHVLRFAQSIQVRGEDGRDLEARQTLADEERDLCRLDVPGLVGPPARRRPADETLQAGEAVITVGNPLGLGVSTSSGLLSTVMQRDGQTSLIVSAPLSPGSSGGGLFDERGRLIGITTAIMVTGQNTNVAVPASGIDDLPSRGKAPPPLAPAPVAEPAWAAEADRLREANDWKALEKWCADWMLALPEVGRAWQLHALALRNLGQHERVEQQLHKALELHPQDFLAWVQLAVLHLEANRDKEAGEALAKARAANPGSGHPDLIEAGFKLARDDLDAAYALASRASTLAPGDPNSWVLLATVAERMKRYPEAARALRIALVQLPRSSEWSAALSRVLLAQGDRKGAQQALAAVSSPDSVAQLIALGNLAYTKQQLTEAEEALRKALALDPNAAQATVTLAATLFDTGRAATATPMLDALLEREPDNVQALRLKSRVLTRERNFREAAELMSKAIALRQDDVDMLRETIALDQAIGDWRGALAHGRQLVSLPAAQRGDNVALAHALIRTGDLAAADALIAQAHREAPDELDVLLAQAALAGKRAQFDKAFEAAGRASTLHPTSGPAWSSRGYSLLKLGRIAEAVPALETAVRLEPDEVNGWINLGNALLQHRQLRRATEVLERALALAPDATDGGLYLAQAHAATGQTDKALKRLEDLTARHPRLVKAWYLKGVVQAQRRDAAGLQLSYTTLLSMDRPSADKLRNGVTQNMPDMKGVFAAP